MIPPIALACCCLFAGLPANTLAQERRFDYTHQQMGAVFRLAFFAADSNVAGCAAKMVFERIDTLNARFSDYLPDSELSRLCDKAGAEQALKVSADLWDILRLSDYFSRQSSGAFDVTVGPLTRLWRRARQLKELPDSTRLESARALVDYRNIRYYPKTHRVRLMRPGMRLDLGGIAQGFAADECLRVLRGYGINRAMADAGGDIALGDPPPGQVGWIVHFPIAGPDGTARDTVLELAHAGITTSGASSRYLEHAGKRYSHIVDPRSGWGLTHRTLVTVQAQNAVTADAWATAISVLGEKGWNSIRRKHKRLQVWLAEMPL